MTITNHKLEELAEEYESIDCDLMTKLAKLVDTNSIATTIEYYFPNHPFDDNWLDAKIEREIKVQVGLYKVKKLLRKDK